MVQGVNLSQYITKCSSTLGNVVKKSACPAGVGVSLLPLILTSFSCLAQKNKKDVYKTNGNSVSNTVSLNAVEYSAWARLKDLQGYKEEEYVVINSKDSNKWKQVNRV